MKTTCRHYIILLVLIFLFAAPGLSAYWLYFHPQWLDKKTTNKGALLNPPVLLSSLEQRNKWHLVLWNPSACEASCLAQLDKLRRIRLALGRRLYDVDLTLVLSAESPALSEARTIMLDKQGFFVTTLPLKESMQLSALYKKPELFISNPENYLVLSYSDIAPPDDLFHDIKLLLAKGN